MSHLAGAVPREIMASRPVLPAVEPDHQLLVSERKVTVPHEDLVETNLEEFASDPKLGSVAENHHEGKQREIFLLPPPSERHSLSAPAGPLREV